MGRLARVFNSVALVGTASAVTWNLLLDDRAKRKVKKAAGDVTNLTNFFLNSYMDPNGLSDDEFAAEHNRSWVEQEWREAGY